MDNQFFKYNNSDICFQVGDGRVLVNATEMAKSFNKKPAKWLELPSAKEFLENLSSVRKSDTSLIQTIMGSPESGGGTWMHEDVALEFARWLSPAFAIWCNDRIKELLKFGVTASGEKLLELLSEPENAIKVFTALKVERDKNKILASENQMKDEQLTLQSNELKEAAPKVEYYENILQTKSAIPITIIAKELGMSGEALNERLSKLNVQYKLDGQWILFSKYQTLGYTTTKTYKYTDQLGFDKTAIHTYWTEKGRLFIHGLARAAKKTA